MLAAQTLVAGLPRTTAIALDVSSTTELDTQIASQDLIISLVPFIYHASITKVAIKHKVNVVTTSNVSEGMRELDTLAKEAGIVVLNEVGGRSFWRSIILCQLAFRAMGLSSRLTLTQNWEC